MKKLALIAFVIFWAVIGGFVLRSLLAPRPSSAVPERAGGRATDIVGALELRRHARASDCWIVVRGAVYDVSTYLPRHPAGEDLIIPWCGRDATQAFTDLGKGATHSARAWRLLEKYRVGTYGAEEPSAS